MNKFPAIDFAALANRPEPQITEDWRWARERDEWVQRPCFRFTHADGRVTWSDLLGDEYRAIFTRQQAERSGAAEQHEAA